MKLNARQVETAKPKDKTYKMADGGGLYLEVSAKGSKYWRMKYRRPSDKKEDRLAFGVWPTVTLAQARAKRDEAKKLLVQGIDPKAEQKEAQAENSGAYTFETIAREWHESNKRWSEDHRSRVLRYLELYIFPHIGSSDIRQLKTSHLLAPIKKVDASVVNMTLHSVFSSVSRLLCVMPYRTIISTLIQPVTWPVRYRQPKHDTIQLYPLAGSLSSLHVLLHIVAV
ncbi:Integrase [Salmonella enterica subsp. houtenae serovar Houten]|nr:Integrase [Salmonella enterica subsp. houtenae serovar Houten]